jgi:Bardet-Biedl syndrome 7 protein
MSSEYKQTLTNADALKKEFENQPRALEYLSGIVTDLYVDNHKFKGHNVTHKIPELLQLLQNYDYDAVVRFFSDPAGQR